MRRLLVPLLALLLLTSPAWATGQQTGSECPADVLECAEEAPQPEGSSGDPTPEPPEGEDDDETPPDNGGDSSDEDPLCHPVEVVDGDETEEVSEDEEGEPTEPDEEGDPGEGSEDEPVDEEEGVDEDADDGIEDETPPVDDDEEVWWCVGVPGEGAEEHTSNPVPAIQEAPAAEPVERTPVLTG